MSNEVYGYIDMACTISVDEFFGSLQEETGIGIKQIPLTELFNYPEQMLPLNETDSVAFILGDAPGKTNTSYLTDYLDYAPDADIGLPVHGKERLGLLINLLVLMIGKSISERLVVAITDSSEISEIKTVRSNDLTAVISADFEDGYIPDCIYEVLK